MSAGHAFDRLKARYCLAAMVVAWYWQPGAGTLIRALPDAPWYWWDLVFHYYADAALILFVAGIVIAVRPVSSYAYVMGRAPARGDLRLILLTVVLTFCASSAIVYLTFMPLSYVYPDFVAWWLRWTYSPVVYLTMDGVLPVRANLLNFTSLVVVSPILQEIIFRGYLLNRWARKWGLWNAVVASSVVFGAIHPDTVSAMVTGIGFALLYLKTRSLWAPIIAHCLYNLIVWLWNLHDVIRAGFAYVRYDTAAFRDEWWMGAVSVAVVLVLVNRVLRGPGALGPFELPAPRAGSA